MKKITRRDLLAHSSRIAASVGIGLPLQSQVTGSGAPSKSHKIKVVVAGAHPDDPESGCGGTIALYSDLGHEVVVLYLTRGEAGSRDPKQERSGGGCHSHVGMPEGLCNLESATDICRTD